MTSLLVPLIGRVGLSCGFASRVHTRTRTPVTLWFYHVVLVQCSRSWRRSSTRRPLIIWRRTPSTSSNWASSTTPGRHNHLSARTPSHSLLVLLP